MKRIFCLLCMGALFLVSCSKKTHPGVSNSSKIPEAKTNPAKPVSEPPVLINPVEMPTPAPAIIPSPMIVIDESGKVITPRDKLPENIASKVDYTKISRSFTQAERQNLIGRFKMIPPRVLFVPDQLASKSAKGSYVVYRKKFWYWKKEDGLFHLDQTYYQ